MDCTSEPLVVYSSRKPAEVVVELLAGLPEPLPRRRIMRLPGVNGAACAAVTQRNTIAEASGAKRRARIEFFIKEEALKGEIGKEGG